ncbi:MAG TPA: trigger factor family protein, partial [Acidimicrobiia bacterium]|nr:trigger factor family protein [Acidimicrobiia bacterium]
MQSTVEPVQTDVEGDGEDTPTAANPAVAKVKLHVSVPAAEFDKAIGAAFKKLAREVKIPGFRPGKAPRQLLEARLGTGIAREQALQ